MKNQIKLIALATAITIAAFWMLSCEKTTDNASGTPPKLSLKIENQSFSISIDSVSSLSNKNLRATVGSLMFKLAGNIVNYNQIKAYKIASSSFMFGNPYLLQSYTNSGQINSYVCRLVGNSLIPIGDATTQGYTNKVVFTRAMLEGDAEYYLCFLGKSYSNFDFALYSQPASFPETSIKSKDATTTNIFSSNGQCVWYAYGRVAELYNTGYISKESFDFIKNGLTGKSDRHARYWPSMIGGNWISGSSSGIADKYKKRGMLVVWVFGSYGHIGFTESISEDLKTYTVSDFNRNLDEKYGTKTYTFGSDKMSGAYPVFLPLKLTN